MNRKYSTYIYPMKTLLTFALGLFLSGTLFSQSIPANQWSYISIDTTREMIQPADGPDWLRSFGIDAADINHDGFKDITSGKYFYLNPGGGYEQTLETDRIQVCF